MSIIMGIDPGSQNTGYGILEIKGNEISCIEYGTLVGKGSFAQRILSIGEAIGKIIKKHSPDSIAIEKIFLGKNADSAFKLGHARGVVLFQAAKNNIAIAEYATRSVKKGITGSGAADKETVQKLIFNLLKIKTSPSFDATDALAVAVYHGQQIEIAAKTNRQEATL